MSHCISVFLVNSKDLTNDQIKSKKWIKLKENILATTKTEDVEDISLYASISTDYFGGFGSQEAEVFENGSIIFEANDEFDFHITPINSALRLLGIISKDNMDEFDTIGLGNYRNNSDFNNK